MEDRELLMHVWTKTTGLSEGELREKLYDDDKLKDDASEILINLDADRVSKIKNSVDKTEIFNDAYKKAKKDEGEKFEKRFRETTGFDSDLQGLDLVQAWGESIKVKPTITEDEIKTHPKYIELEKEIAGRYSENYNKLQTDFDSYKLNVERNTTMSSVLKEAEDVFMGLNPALSDDPVKAKNQKSMFLERFKRYEYELVDGKHLVKENGKRIEDKHGNPVYLDSFVSGLTSQYFDTKVQTQRVSPGNRSQTTTSSTAPKTKEEYARMVSEATSDEEKARIGLAWQAIQDK